MSHFCVFVLLPNGTEAGAIPDALEGMLAPYDENKETEPRWEDEENVDAMSKFCETDDLDALAARMDEWAGSPGRVHEGRLQRQTTSNPRAKWDWYQVGGRWSGQLDPSYDPHKDPRNIETCDLCGGTGRRNDAIGQAARATNPSYGCNGCEGEGKRVKWPTQWAAAPGNAAPVYRVLEIAEADPGVLARVIVTPDGDWHERGEMRWFGMSRGDVPAEKWVAKARELLSANADCMAVVVDCHI